jgi:hypothetical protein
VILPFLKPSTPKVKFEPSPAISLRWSRPFKRQGQGKAEQVQATGTKADVFKDRADGWMEGGGGAPVDFSCKPLAGGLKR